MTVVCPPQNALFSCIFRGLRVVRLPKIEAYCEIVKTLEFQLRWSSQSKEEELRENSISFYFEAMERSARRPSSSGPRSRLKRQPSFTRVYCRKRSFIVKHCPKLVLLCVALAFLSHRQKSAWSQFQSLAECEKTVQLKISPRPVFNLTLSLGVRRKGVSLVSACQNHHEALRYTLPSWTNVKSLDEIILIDWSSKPALHFLVEELKEITDEDPTLYVIEVTGPSKWEPSRAFNLGFRAAHYSHVLRVDCDHKVREDFIETHNLPKKAFFAGNAHLERSQSDEDLFGTLFVEKKNFFDAGGYDERIQNIGGEQENLFNRLKEIGLQRVNIDYDKLLHNHHNDNASGTSPWVSEVEKRIEAETEVALLREVPPWNNLEAWRSMSFDANSLSSVNGSMQSRSHSNVHYRKISASSHVPSFREMTSEHALDNAKQIVVSSILLQDFEIPTEFSDILPLSDKVELLKKLIARKFHTSKRDVPRVLVLHCVNGLASRLHALSSGLSFAAQTERLPIIIWQKESRIMTASFAELFQVGEDTAVINTIPDTFPTSLFAEEYRKRRGTMAVYDFTKNHGQTKEVIRNDPHVHIYAKASRAIMTDVLRHTSSLAMGNQLRNLILDESIEADLRNLEDRGLSKALGIYIPHSTRNESLDFRALTSSVRENLRKAPAAAKIYVDANLHMLERLRREFPSTLIAAPRLKSCDGEASCTRNEMDRLFALSRTALLMCPYEDELSTLVRLVRGESTNW